MFCISCTVVVQVGWLKIDHDIFRHTGYDLIFFEIDKSIHFSILTLLSSP